MSKILYGSNVSGSNVRLMLVAEIWKNICIWCVIFYTLLSGTLIKNFLNFVSYNLAFIPLGFSFDTYLWVVIPHTLSLNSAQYSFDLELTLYFRVFSLFLWRNFFSHTYIFLLFSMLYIYFCIFTHAAALGIYILCV